MSIFNKNLLEQKLRKLTLNNSGVTAIEMALIAPFLFLLIVGTLEMGMVIFVNVVLEGATTTAARDAKTGNFSADPNVDDDSREKFIEREIVKRSAGLIDKDLLEFEITSYEDNILDADSSTGNSAGGPGDLVVMTVKYPWNFITPMVGKHFGDPYWIQSKITYRNEPS